MRRAGELEAIQAVRNEMLATASTHPDILDNLDFDALWQKLMIITDAPRSISVGEKRRKEIRDQRQADKQQAQQMQQFAEGAAAAKDAGGAISAVNGLELGVL